MSTTIGHPFHNSNMFVIIKNLPQSSQTKEGSKYKNNDSKISLNLPIFTNKYNRNI